VTVYSSIRYEIEGRVATITLDRPSRLNAIDERMPTELRDAVEHADVDDSVHVIVVTGAGRSFCSGYDLELFAETEGPNPGVQEMPWDPTVDYRMMARNTADFMSLWRSPKPTIAKVRGHAVAGGSDIALTCDIVIMAEDARIGYPPARVWGTPTTAMWLYRLGAERAKRMLFTGDLIDGREAERIGLVLEAVPAAELDDRVAELASRMASIPRSQLMMQKLMINQAYENMGLASTQMVATVFDGVARHSPEGVWWKRRAEEVGFRQAVVERDSGDPIAPEVAP
jgi:enoyl-CoA hydratase